MRSGNRLLTSAICAVLAGIVGAFMAVRMEMDTSWVVTIGLVMAGFGAFFGLAFRIQF